MYQIFMIKHMGQWYAWIQNKDELQRLEVAKAVDTEDVPEITGWLDCPPFLHISAWFVVTAVEKGGVYIVS